MAASKEQLVKLATVAAAKHGLEAPLVCAVVEQESSWDPFAMRYEQGFRMKYVSPKRLQPTEEITRSMSWGLMQVMGEDAREFGFEQTSLAALSEPATGLDVGCTVLAHKLRIENGNINRALLAWNGGGNPAYDKEVLARVPQYISLGL